MPCIVTRVQKIVSKSGKFTIYDGILENGESFRAFLTEAQAVEFDFPEAAITTPTQLKELFKEMPVSEVNFDQRGRVYALSSE